MAARLPGEVCSASPWPVVKVCPCLAVVRPLLCQAVVPVNSQFLKASALGWRAGQGSLWLAPALQASLWGFHHGEPGPLPHIPVTPGATGLPDAFGEVLATLGLAFVTQAPIALALCE